MNTTRSYRIQSPDTARERVVTPRRRFLSTAAMGLAAVSLPRLSRGLTADAAPARDGKWIPLFNGKDFDGWTPITGYDLGDNWKKTFRVEDGLLKVAYDQYEKFDGQFGNIFWREKLSHYVIRVEYRFIGQQTSGGPGWAFRNSGIMLHCQAPESMTKGNPWRRAST